MYVMLNLRSIILLFSLLSIYVVPKGYPMKNITRLEIPKWGLSMEEGTVTNWLIKEGDTFSEGQEIVEIETSKISNVLEAPFSGRLDTIIANSGETLPVGALIGLCADDDLTDEDVKAFLVEQSEGVPETADVAEPLEAAEEQPTPEIVEVAVPDNADGGDVSANETAGIQSGYIRATRHALRLAQQYGVDLTKVKGTSRHGRVSQSDVEQYLQDVMGVAVPAKQILQTSIPVSKTAKLAKSSVTASAGVHPEPLTSMRKAIAKRLQTSSQEAPHYTVQMECHLDHMLEIRERINKRSQDIKISINDFIIRACAQALVEHPECNIQFDGENIYQFDRVDVCVAVALPNGLITPKIPSVEKKSLSEIAAEMADLASRAKSGRLMPDEFTGGTFTISNLGMYGVSGFDAIINPPQVCILAVGGLEKKYREINGKPKFVQVMTLTLSSDHRVIDGAVAAQFLSSIKTFLETPYSLVL